MKLNTTSHATVMRSAFVAPTLGAARGEVCLLPRVGHSRPAPITGDAGMVTGHRPWSPLIT